MTIFKHFAKAIYNKAKLSKMTDFVDEIEIDKLRNTAEILHFRPRLFVLFFFFFYRL